MLRNKKYVDLINNTIDNTLIEYSVPVYNFEKIHNIPLNEISLTINDALFLDTLLMNIRGKTIRFSAKEKRNQNDKENKLIKEIEYLENNLTLNILTVLIEDKKTELQEIRNIKLKGNMVRSHAQWLDEGERPTKKFCTLENKNFLDKTIKKIHDDNDKIVTDQKSILTTIGKYYTKLLENRDADLD